MRERDPGDFAANHNSCHNPYTSVCVTNMRGDDNHWFNDSDSLTDVIDMGRCGVQGTVPDE